MTKRPMPPRLPEPEVFDTAFESYAIEIGFLIREWNYLQAKLCDLFSTLLGIRDGAIAIAIWYAVQNDRLQRKILLDTATAIFAKKSKILDAITWLVKNADAIGSQRDDAIHSPVAMVVGDPIEFISLYFHGHPRAMTLKGKKLLKEFKVYRERTVALKNYATHLELHLRRHRNQWQDETRLLPLPGKPSLPSAAQKGIGGS